MARLKDQYGEDAHRGVVAYVQERKAASLPVTHEDAQRLARPFMMMRADGWSQELCLRAVREYAATARSPLYFREWVMQTFHREGDNEHARQKAEAPTMTGAEFDAFLELARVETAGS